MKEATKEEEKKNLQIKDCPLSMDAWMTVLSSEINRKQEILLHYFSVFLVSIAVVAATVFGYLAILKDIPGGDYLMGIAYFSTILSLFALFVCIVVIYEYLRFRKIIKTLESIREGAIAGRIDSNETYKRWSEEYIKLTKKILGFFN